MTSTQLVVAQAKFNLPHTELDWPHSLRSNFCVLFINVFDNTFVMFKVRTLGICQTGGGTSVHDLLLKLRILHFQDICSR